MRISYSGLDTFSTCPAKYKFQYVERIKTPKIKEAIFGTLIHDCLKMFHEPGRPIPLSEDELLKYFTQKWNPDIYPNPEEDAFAFHQGVDILKRYFLQNQNTQFNIINLESSFQIPITEGEETHQITGRIDRIDKLEDGSFEVIDYKTTKKMPSQDLVDDNFQLSIYYLGLISRWPTIKEENRPVKLSLYYLRHGEKLSAVKSADQIKETYQKITDSINQIQKSKFEPKANPLCDWCSYQPHCPLYRHKFIKEDSPAPDDKKIKQVLSEFFIIKDRQTSDTRRLNELKGEINKYCDQNKFDRIFGEEGYITRLPQQRFTYDFKQVKDILEPIGKWEEILTINQTKLKKIIDSLSYDLQKEIDQIKTPGKEFKVIKVSRKK